MMNRRINPNSPALVGQQLRAALTEAIADGSYPVGHRFPSERALAETYGVSRTSVRETVAQLLSEGILVRTGSRGTFVAAPKAASAAMTEAPRQIGFWIGADVFNFVQPGYNQILTGVGEACRHRGYSLQFHAVEDGEAGVDFLRAAAPENGGPDGNLVVGGVNRRVLAGLLELKTPLALVDQLLDERHADAVRIDYASGLRQAINHLESLGHQDIGFIGFAGSQKHEAFWMGLEERGLPYHPRFTKFLSPSDLLPGILAGYQATQKLLTADRVPTALITTNDLVAQGVLEALAIGGVRVPEELSVIGCDDLGIAANRLTTIQVDLMEVGRVAANLLLDRIERGVENETPVLFPVKLLIRGTTAPPRSTPALAAPHLPQAVQRE